MSGIWDYTGSFQQVAENFLARHVKAKGKELRTHYEIERIIGRYLMPRWRDRQFQEIQRRDIANLLDIVEDEHGPRQADMLLAVIRKMMNWYATRDDDYRSPVVRGMHRHGQHKRERWLDDDEIRALWAGLSLGSRLRDKAPAVNRPRAMYPQPRARPDAKAWWASMPPTASRVVSTQRSGYQAHEGR